MMAGRGKPPGHLQDYRGDNSAVQNSQ